MRNLDIPEAFIAKIGSAEGRVDRFVKEKKEMLAELRLILLGLPCHPRDERTPTNQTVARQGPGLGNLF